MVERYSLFADEEELHLTEHVQHPQLMAAISTGCTLSEIHALGLLHGDLHGDNSLFSWYSGAAGLVDLDDLVPREISPDRMVADFLVPRVRMGFAWCQALLAGYLKISRLSIDPVYPGYCDDLLDLLGGSVVSDPRPRSPTLPPEMLDEALAWLGSDLLPARPVDQFWRARSTSAQCAFMVGALFCAGIDCSVLASDPSAGARTSSHEAIRTLIDSAVSKQELRVSCPDDIPQAAWDFILLSLRDWITKARETDSRIKPNAEIFSTISQLKDSYPGRDVEDMLCAFTDVLDWLAARADREAGGSPRDLSIQSAQATYMLLQLISDPAAVESAELATASRHARLSWYPALVNKTVEVPDQDLLYLFAYTNSRVSSYRRMFEGEDMSPGRGRPWTAIWRAMAMARHWLLNLLARRLADKVPFEPCALLDQSIGFSANNLGVVLSMHAQTMLVTQAAEYMLMPPAMKERSGFENIQREIDVLIGLLGLVKSREPGSRLESEYISLGSRYIDIYSQVSPIPFDDVIAR